MKQGQREQEGEFSKIRFAKPRSSGLLSNTAAVEQSFQLPNLRHNFLSSKTISKVEVIQAGSVGEENISGEQRNGKFKSNQ